MPYGDPPWPGTIQPWDIPPRPGTAISMTTGSVCSSPLWTCKHCGRGHIPDTGPHWCPGSADEANRKAIDDAIVLLGHNGYVVERREPSPVAEPWRFGAES